MRLLQVVILLISELDLLVHTKCFHLQVPLISIIELYSQGNSGFIIIFMKKTPRAISTFFGTVYGDNQLYVKNSSLNDSYFYSCGKYLFLWCEVSVMDLGELYGTVGHFYNVMEWVSDEEADRLKREEGL